MECDQTYVIPLDYGDRKKEREFVRAILNRYDRDTLVGAVLFVNNNPYSLQSFLCLNFWKDSEDFEQWLSLNYPTKSRDFRFLFSEIGDAVFKRGFNIIGFTDDSMLELQMSDEANGIYLFPSRDVMNEKFGKPNTASTLSVFLSHSSSDKPFVDSVFAELHKSDIRAWYDRYEIRPGDSITESINEGLRKCHLGLLFFSKNFLDPRSGWPMSEANYFFSQRMKDKKKRFIVINIDLNVSEMPPLMQDYLYIDIRSPSAVRQIIDAIIHEQKFL